MTTCVVKGLLEQLSQSETHTLQIYAVFSHFQVIGSFVISSTSLLLRVCFVALYFLLLNATLSVKKKKKHKFCIAQELPRPSILWRADISLFLHFPLSLSLSLYLSGLSPYHSYARSKPTMGVQSFIVQKVSPPVCPSILRQSADNNPCRFSTLQISILHPSSFSPVLCRHMPPHFLLLICLVCPFCHNSKKA